MEDDEISVGKESFHSEMEFETKKDVKSYNSLKLCQTCVLNDSCDNLKDMMQTHIYQGRIEVYSDMLEYCFNFQMGDDQRERLENSYMICDACIDKLREIVSFRNQVETAQKNIHSKILKASIKKTSSLDESDSEDNVISDEDVDNFLSDLNEENTTSESAQTNSRRKPYSKADMDHPKESKKVIVQKKGEKLTSKFLKKYIKQNPMTGRKSLRVNEVPFVLKSGQKQCKMCRESFDTEQGLKIHMSLHFPNFTCKICGRLFYNRMGILMHLKSHSSERFECTKCPGKIFKRKRSLSIHEKIKHAGDPYIHKCSYCGERFKYHHQRVKHLIKAHNKTEEMNKYKCKLCDKSFQLSNARASHIRKVHMLERNHSCTDCGKQFFTKADIQKHLLTHTGVRNFRCAVCSKSYLRKSTLTEHMKIHTGMKNHICKVCDKAFTQKCTLKSHMLSLHNVRMIV